MQQPFKHDDGDEDNGFGDEDNGFDDEDNGFDDEDNGFDDEDNGFDEYLLAVFLLCSTIFIFQGSMQAGSNYRNFQDYQVQLEKGN